MGRGGAIAAREESARESFVREFTGEDVTNPRHCDILFNDERNTVEQIAELAAAAMRARRLV